ncbi:Flagellar hook protein FlgE [Bosea sp. 62]|uniref:flagellar hook protein FlgE n=1 Tax=unclassified Bosea (in: a-proteobacteria) TaxID=2653178 RepID=UPI001250DD8D|nr:MULTISPECIES: flagellar hook-basal body complex protein [unclassified Bosea (in: a-proteobacteria)]CAD5267733.1 Flagellar hook protein FlgE [Bosea sp. 46]CAD5268878.1 Flagellar hook protein FlgE [Bosea sp. 7B]CAD5269734.1 Flagellar hook protein FlgE [Bosea sp. 21B]VVT62552.1 Flagellar hook protein FlgE [Bosea sp. EC-HK365B]VXB97349.1 Flagellar hook protein FlgE [Bosea sp. 29B]
MGVFSALTTAVTGMQAQSYALENISGNIANSRTAGFKRVDTSFSDLVPDSALNRQVAGSVASYSRATNTIQGDLNATRIDTNAAINGDGFFVVDQRKSGVGASTQFSNSNLYTRRGDFDFDADGYLVNGAGYYLKGQKIDPVTGQIIGSQPDVLRITKDQFPAKATTQIEYSANIPAYPKTNSAVSTTPGSELLNAGTGFGTNPSTTASGGTGTVVGSDLTTFLNRSIPGGSVTVYDTLGKATSVELRWAKVSNAAGATPDTWNLFIAENTGATGATVAYRNVNTDITFDNTGKMTAPASGNITIPPMTIGGNAISPATAPISIVTNGTSLTQNGDTSGQIDARSIRQNGYTAGTLDRVSISNEGQVIGTFSNGQVVPLAQIAVARFNAGNALKRLDGGAFEETIESGAPIVGLGTAALIGGNVEQSNTDIADEFSKMIVTQQAYSANTKVISTAQEMLRDVFNIIR